MVPTTDHARVESVPTVSLVNLDQLEALHALRASVSSEKEDLEGQVDSLRSALRDAEDRARQQLDEVNRLLSERVREQDGGISVRDRALQLEAELRYVSRVACSDRLSGGSGSSLHFIELTDNFHICVYREARAALAARDADSARLSALEREKTDLLEKVQKMKEVGRRAISRALPKLPACCADWTRGFAVYQAAGQALPGRAGCFVRQIQRGTSNLAAFGLVASTFLLLIDPCTDRRAAKEKKPDCEKSSSS